MLDLAKPLYTDVFCEMLYADHIYDAPRIEYALEDRTMKITVNASKDRLGKRNLEHQKTLLS